jgi:hypothetical protein
VAQTFSPERDRRTEALTLAATFGTAVAVVIVFFPVEGRVLTPVHALLEGFLGQAAFLVPLGLGLAAACGFLQRARPKTRPPGRALAGLGLITIGLFPAERLLGQSTGLLGEWFTGALVGLLGGPLTVVITMALIGLGSILAFDVWRRRLATR